MGLPSQPKSFAELKTQLTETCAFLESFSLGRVGFTQQDVLAGIRRVRCQSERLKEFATGPHRRGGGGNRNRGGSTRHHGRNARRSASEATGLAKRRGPCVKLALSVQLRVFGRAQADRGALSLLQNCSICCRMNPMPHRQLRCRFHEQRGKIQSSIKTTRSSPPLATLEG